MLRAAHPVMPEPHGSFLANAITISLVSNAQA